MKFCIRTVDDDKFDFCNAVIELGADFSNHTAVAVGQGRNHIIATGFLHCEL